MSTRSGIEDAARGGRIVPHLRAERVQRGEALLVAQLRRELHFQLPTIQVAGEIEYVRLEQRLDATDRGPRAEARDARQRAPRRAVDAHGEDPGHRCAPTLERQVSGWKS